MMLEKSRGVEGKVWHARHHPVKHAFEYSVYFFKLDVDEIENSASKQGLFGFNRWNILSLADP